MFGLFSPVRRRSGTYRLERWLLYLGRDKMTDLVNKYLVFKYGNIWLADPVRDVIKTEVLRGRLEADPEAYLREIGPIEELDDGWEDDGGVGEEEDDEFVELKEGGAQRSMLEEIGGFDRDTILFCELSEDEQDQEVLCEIRKEKDNSIHRSLLMGVGLCLEEEEMWSVPHNTDEAPSITVVGQEDRHVAAMWLAKAFSKVITWRKGAFQYTCSVEEWYAQSQEKECFSYKQLLQLLGLNAKGKFFSDISRLWGSIMRMGERDYMEMLMIITDRGKARKSYEMMTVSALEKRAKSEWKVNTDDGGGLFPEIGQKIMLERKWVPGFDSFSNFGIFVMMAKGWTVVSCSWRGGVRIVSHRRLWKGQIIKLGLAWDGPESQKKQKFFPITYRHQLRAAVSRLLRDSKGEKVSSFVTSKHRLEDYFQISGCLGERCDHRYGMCFVRMRGLRALDGYVTVIRQCREVEDINRMGMELDERYCESRGQVSLKERPADGLKADLCRWKEGE